MATTLKLGDSKWATKDGYLLAYNDENGNFKPLPFNFTRSTSGTRVNKDGLIEVVTNNKPRIDFLNDSNGALLLEPERRNLVTYSESFDNAAWIKVSNTSISDNFAISPDGTQNSSEIKATSTSTSVLGFYTGFTVSSGVEYTISFFVKKGIVKYIQLYHAFSQVAGVPRTNFDLENGVVSVSDAGHTSSIEDYGNGWYRCIVKLTTATTILQTFFNAVKLPYAPRDASSSWSANDNFYFYGAQLEQGSYPTSYIPTNGSTATRSAETCNGAGDASTFNDSEGVLFAEISALANDGNERYIYLGDGTTANRIVIRFSPTVNDLRILLTSGGATQVSSGTTSYDILLLNKIAFKYKQNDFALWVNGVKVLTDTSGITPIGLNQLSLSFNPVEFYGNTKQIQYFNTALNDTDLETLTSWDSFSDMAIGQLYTIE